MSLTFRDFHLWGPEGRFDTVIGGGVSSTTEVKSVIEDDSKRNWLEEGSFSSEGCGGGGGGGGGGSGCDCCGASVGVWWSYQGCFDGDAVAFAHRDRFGDSFEVAWAGVSVSWWVERKPKPETTAASVGKGSESAFLICLPSREPDICTMEPILGTPVFCHLLLSGMYHRIVEGVFRFVEVS